MIDGWGFYCEIALSWMSVDLTDDKSTWVQEMAWYHQATNYYLNILSRVHWIKLNLVYSIFALSVYIFVWNESIFQMDRETWFFLFVGNVYDFMPSINPLRAEFFRVNINIYLHFMSFLHTNKTQVVEIPPRVRQGPAYSTSISWLLMSWRLKEPGHQQPWYWSS